MKTPIVDFVRKYADNNFSRFHMPGHKGREFLGFEKYDITEICGADCLSSADGIIQESEDNASSLFSTAHTFYSAFGSSAAICAMLYLACKGKGEKPIVLASRNVHRSFIHGSALLDIDVRWIMQKNNSHIAKCDICSKDVEEAISKCPEKPAAVYITSPDYLGNILDIKSISSVCRKYGVLLLTDNAHGAYLAFTKEKMHPIHLGADMCSDSAHKTLPVLTGGAYLHISKDSPKNLLDNARDALMLFSSTSPSYLVLQSLDLCNAYIENGYREKLGKCIENVNELKLHLSQNGFCIAESEPLKIVFNTKKMGYTGFEFADILRNGKIEIEYADIDYVVFMITPENTSGDFKRIKETLDSVKIKTEFVSPDVNIPAPKAKLSIREAVFSQSEVVSGDNAIGRICAELTVSCPPAIPIAISGEEITKDHITLFENYGIGKIKVVK